MFPVGASDTAQHTDADRVRPAVALQQFAVLGAPPLSQKMNITGLYQDMVFQEALCAVLAQVGLAQRGLAAQAGLHGWLGLLKAEVTRGHLVPLARIFPLLFTLPFALSLLLTSESLQKLLHYAAQLDVGLQLHSGVCAGGAQRADEGAGPAAAGLLDARLAEAVTADQGHGVVVDAQADGTGQQLLQPGHSTRLRHGAWGNTQGRGPAGGYRQGKETESGSAGAALARPEAAAAAAAAAASSRLARPKPALSSAPLPAGPQPLRPPQGTASPQAAPAARPRRGGAGRRAHPCSYGEGSGREAGPPPAARPTLLCPRPRGGIS